MRLEPLAKVLVRGSKHEWTVADPPTLEFEGRTYVRVVRWTPGGREVRDTFVRGDVTVSA